MDGALECVIGAGRRTTREYIGTGWDNVFSRSPPPRPYHTLQRPIHGKSYPPPYILNNLLGIHDNKKPQAYA